MAHAIGMRATSLRASALVLSAAVIMALTATYNVHVNGAPDREPTIVSVHEAPPPAPIPPSRPIEDRPIPVQQDIAIYTPLLAPSQPSDDTQYVDFSPPREPLEITRPDWIRRPSGLARYYPSRALQRGIEGAVTLDCLVRVSGDLDCAPIAETPAGWGFSEAAVRISRDYQMLPATLDGRAVEGRYRMRIPFSIE